MDRMRADLDAVGGGLQSGDAKFESRSDRTRFSCEVEDVSGGGTLTVKVDGMTVGTIALEFDSATGLFGGDLNLDDRDGDTVPNMVPGDSIDVIRGTATILSGSF